MLLSWQFSRRENSPSQALFSPLTEERLPLQFLKGKVEKPRTPQGWPGLAKHRMETEDPANHSCRSGFRRAAGRKRRDRKETLKNTVETPHADLQHWGEEHLVVGGKSRF